MARSSSNNAGEPENSLRRRNSSSSASSKERNTRNSSLEHPNLESKENVSKVIRLPDTWTRVSNFGEPIHRFVPFKLPLNVKELTGVDEYYKFGWKRLILGLAEKSIELGLVIDLSGDSLPTLQDSKSCIVELERLDVSTCPLAGRSYEEFAQTVNEFLEDEQNSMKYIGVYCLFGVDLSGLFICKYLICNDRWMPSYAIKMFSMARGHEIRNSEYLDHLRTLKPGTHVASVGKVAEASKPVEVKSEMPDVVKEEPISDVADEEVRPSKKKKKKRVKKRSKKKSSSANRSSASSLSRRSPQAYKLKNSNVLLDDLDTISSATDDNNDEETEQDSTSSDEAKQSMKNKHESDSTRSSKASSSRKIQDSESVMSKKSKVSSPRSRKESSQTTKSRRGSSLSTAESSQSRSPVASKGQNKLPQRASPPQKRSPRVSPKRERESSGSSSERRAPLPTLSDRYRSIDENMKLQQKKLEDVLKKEKAEQEQVRINDEKAKAMRYTDPKHFQRKRSKEKSRNKSSDVEEKSSKRKRDQVQPKREVSSSSERNSTSIENSRSKRNGEKMRDSKSPSRKRRKSGSHCDPVALSKEAARIKRELRSITDEESDRERKKRKEQRTPPKTYSQKWLKDNFSSVSKDSDRSKNTVTNSKSRDRDRGITGNTRARSRSPANKTRNRLDSSASRNEKSRRSSPDSSSRYRKGPVSKRDLSPIRNQRRRSKSKDKPSQRSTSVGRSRRSRSKDRKRSISRNRGKRSRSKEKVKRSLSREKPRKSKSIDRSRKSRSRDRNRRSRSRDRNRKSRSRDKSRKSRSRERRGRANVDNISSYQKDKEEAQKSTKNFMRELVGQIQNNKLDVDHRDASKETSAKQNCGPSLDLDEYKNRILGVMAEDGKEAKTETESQSNSYQTTINVVGHVSVDYQTHIPVAPPLNPLVVHSFPKYSTFDTPAAMEVKSVHSQESGEALSQDEQPEQETKQESKQQPGADTKEPLEKEPKKDDGSNPTPGTNRNPNYRPRYSPETQLITKAIRHFAPKLGGVRPVLDGTFTPIVRPPPLARVRPPLPPTPAVQVAHRPAPMYNAMSMAPRNPGNPVYVSRPPLAPIAAEPRMPFRGPQNYVRGVPVPIRRPVPAQQFAQRPPLRPPNGPMHYRPESESYFEPATYHNGIVGRPPPPIRQRMPPPPDNNLNITML